MHYILYELKYFLFIFLILRLYIFIYTNISKKISLIFLISLLTFISAIRCNYGSDFYSYYKVFNYATNLTGNIKLYLENGESFLFYPMEYFVKKSFESPYAIFWICSIIIYPLLFSWINKHSNDMPSSVFLFFLFGFFDITNNILKQCIAMPILLFAYDYLLDKKIIRFGICAFLACGFHISSIVIIIMMIISSFLRINIKLYYLIISSSIVLVLFYPLIATKLLQRIPIFERFLIYGEGRIITLPFFITSLLYSAILIYFFHNLYKRHEIYKINNKRLNLIALSSIFAILSIRYIVIIRICLIGLIQLTVLITSRKHKIISFYKSRIKVMPRIFLIMISFFIITCLSSGNNRYYDYSTQFTDTPQEKWYR